MRWIERYEQIIEIIDDYLDELSGALLIKLPYYPEVYWLGRTLEFDDLCLPENLRDVIEDRMREGASYYIPRQRIIVIGRCCVYNSIMEESSHAFHFIVSNASFSKCNAREVLCMGALVEMIGMLGARLLGSEMKSPYESFPDIFAVSLASSKSLTKILEEKISQNVDVYSFFVHQQGYGLADRIYFQYLAGNVSISQIRRLFLSNFSGRSGPIGTFARLRKKYWPVEEQQAI